jgi:hypothetical protein
MSSAPIFSLCASSDAVTQLLGSHPTRLYPFGQAPQNVAKPYAVWQVIGGNPDNYMSDRPDTDMFSLQIDVYAESGSSATDVGDAIRFAIELDAYTTSYNGDSRDEQTGHYRHSFDVDWIVTR